MAITALPTPPSRSDPTTFADRGDAFMGALPTFATEASALQTDVNSKAIQVSSDSLTASSAAATATSAIATVSAAAGATLWTSGTGTTVGDVRYSPVNQRIYRRTVAGNTTTDPSAASGNWAVLDPAPPVVITSSTAFTTAPGLQYLCTGVTAVTVTLHASPAANDTVSVIFANDLYTNVITSGANTIMGLAAPMNVDALNIGINLRFINSSWRLV